MTFESLRLAEPILRAVAAEGYSAPTPIQLKSIPHVLDRKDLLGCAQTGTGKTAAFALPILHLLSEPAPHASGTAHPSPQPAADSHSHHAAHADHTRDGHSPRSHAKSGHHAHKPAGRRSGPRALILSPTRELALQIEESFRTYGRNLRLSHTVIFGGVGQGKQVQALNRGVDILVATPGRLIDLMNQGHINLANVEIFVLDEADRMLDMGFIADIRRVVAKLPSRRQTLMFSATMPRDIRELADTILRDPVSVEVAAVSSTAERIAQCVYFVEKRQKPALLAHVLRAEPPQNLTLVFTRTKHGADRVARDLGKAGIRAEAIHGNKRQNVRQRALEGFRTGRPPVLVATDIAARGIDIDDIALVVNFDLPNVPETYVHRIGRTGRAGASGHAVAFCDHEERAYLKDIEKLTKQQIPVRKDLPELPFSAPRPVHSDQQHASRPVERTAANATRGGDGDRSGNGRDGHSGGGGGGRSGGGGGSKHKPAHAHRSSDGSGKARPPRGKPSHAPKNPHGSKPSHTGKPSHGPKSDSHRGSGGGGHGGKHSSPSHGSGGGRSGAGGGGGGGGHQPRHTGSSQSGHPKHGPSKKPRRWGMGPSRHR